MDRKSQIREIIAEYAGIETPIDELGDDDNLFDAGMTSQGSVSLLTALEIEFDLEIPDELISSVTFASVNAIEAALEASLAV